MEQLIIFGLICIAVIIVFAGSYYIDIWNKKFNNKTKEIKEKRVKDAIEKWEEDHNIK